MKITKLPVALMGLALALSACNSGAGDVQQSETVSGEATNFGYSLGAVIAGQVKNDLAQGERDAVKFAAGFKQGMQKDTAAFESADGVIKQYFEQKMDSTKTPEANPEISYHLGVLSSSRLAFQFGIPATAIDYSSFEKACSTSFVEGELEFSKEQLDSIIQNYMQTFQAAKMKEQAEKDSIAASVNIEAGKEFLAKNAKEEGVVVTASGLQYKVLKEGTGEQATINDQVVTHYHGTLIDGSVFDSSVDRGEPATFPVGGVIKGWQEGIPLMKVGAKYRFYIASDLAYGNRAMGPKIPAGSTLIFDVELLEVKK